MNPNAIADFLIARKIPKYRLKQINKAVYQDGISDFRDISTLPKELREMLSKNLTIFSFETTEVVSSRNGKTIKARIELKDNKLIETVLISSSFGLWTACVSCQTGCVLGCTFCATGRIQKMRNLSAEEITDQVLFWKHYLMKNRKGERLSNVVYMGMGEPFLNWIEVAWSINSLIEPETFNIGSRSISVSTAGIPEGVINIAKKFPQVNLAISLHSADQKIREELMPSARKYRLSEIERALKEYFKICNRKVFLEYLMLEKINDSEKDARKLAEWVNGIGHRQLLHVNLIAYNQTGSGFSPTSPDRIRKFKNLLLRQGISVTTRKSLGQDILGACGQLAQKQ